MSNPTTYVLVHGAWHDGQSWNRVAPLLTAQGHRVFTPSLTGHGDKAHLLSPEVGLTTHVDDIVGLILDHDLSDIVLVGHSYAGMVISSVANRVSERVSRLVYIDAMVPTHGENAIDVMPLTQVLIDGAGATAQPWRIPPLPEFPAPLGLFGVTDPDDTAWLKTTLTDESVLCFQQPAEMDNPAQTLIPRVHILCVGSEAEGVTRRPIPATQPNGEPSRVYELETGHDSMITMPVELSDLLLENA
ncbi:alpha/beta fold hydrolase [Streptomyces sp. AK02-01A]|uniref:alpha/beta fold hydrolase n=1 Tax=Streptomyces sp. AK02-01A TaxID=3028648 RepID=UPI0029B6772B|nr:alpha/beta fold hydrolase [Streptomyces sp. AK02-01A]MDX3853997.1 alpha/beta fold hydrolase [Streptomyces sp. AK02-01A]